MTISDRSSGHNLVYSVATGQGGYGSKQLYELYLRTLDGVSGGRRRPTERERHERVVKPLSAIFKYLDQVHVDKGDCPDLKVPDCLSCPDLKVPLDASRPLRSWSTYCACVVTTDVGETPME